jgi:hypothetical protein
LDRRIHESDIEVGCSQSAARQHNQRQSHHDRCDDDDALRGQVFPRQRGRRGNPAAPIAIAQRGADEPPCPQAQRDGRDFNEDIAGEQNIEEALDMPPELDHARCSIMPRVRSCVEIRYQLALQARDLVLEHELALLQALHLQFVDLEVHAESGNDVVEIAMFNAQLTQALDVLEQIRIDVGFFVAHLIFYAICPPHGDDAIG